jgi:hypothetical protein
MRRGFLSFGKSFEACTVHQKDIQPAIVVVVVECDTATRGLEKILIPMLAAIDCLCVQASFASDVQKVDTEIGFQRLFWFLVVSAEKPARRRETENAFKRKNERGPAE